MAIAMGCCMEHLRRRVAAHYRTKGPTPRKKTTASATWSTGDRAGRRGRSACGAKRRRGAGEIEFGGRTRSAQHEALSERAAGGAQEFELLGRFDTLGYRDHAEAPA